MRLGLGRGPVSVSNQFGLLRHKIGAKTFGPPVKCSRYCFVFLHICNKRKQTSLERFCPIRRRFHGPFQTHMSTHVEDKCYPCPDDSCEKEFRRNCDLRRHLSAHTPESQCRRSSQSTSPLLRQSLLQATAQPQQLSASPRNAPMLPLV